MKHLFIYIILFTFCLNSFSQSDSLIYSWKFVSGTKVHSTIDTALANYNVHNPAFRKSISNTFLGNIGQEVVSNQADLFLSSDEFIFFKPFSLYYSDSENKFYNTRRPFTLIHYTGGGKKEYSLDILHTQNVNKNLNFGLKYSLLNSEGMYLRQTTKNFLISFFSSFENHRYSFHAYSNLYRINLHQSGGITNDGFVTDSVNWEPAGMTVWLPNAFSKINRTTISVKHNYKLGRTHKIETKDSVILKSVNSPFSLYHQAQYETDYRLYTEQIADTNLHSVFYRPDATKDSLHMDFLDNTIGLQYEYADSNNTNITLKAGLSNEIRNYFNSYYYYTANDTSYISNSFKASFTYIDTAGNYFLSNAKLGLTGYNQGDLTLNVSISKRIKKGFFRIMGGVEKKTPDYFENRIYSNHLIREHNFLDKNTSQLRTSYYLPKYKVESGIHYFILDNFVYFNSSREAVQNTSTFNILMAYITKTFEWSKFFIENHIYYQIDGNTSAVSLPDILLKHSLYYKFPWDFKVTKGHLDVILGMDVYYNTKYYMMGYDPALGLFYNQTGVKKGNYPFASVFVNVKLKRARFFAKMEHINEGLINPNYFMALHYPANQRIFRFGISWSFYD